MRGEKRRAVASSAFESTPTAAGLSNNADLHVSPTLHECTAALSLLVGASASIELVSNQLLDRLSVADMIPNALRPRPSSPACYSESRAFWWLTGLLVE